MSKKYFVILTEDGNKLVVEKAQKLHRFNQFRSKWKTVSKRKLRSLITRSTITSK